MDFGLIVVVVVLGLAIGFLSSVVIKAGEQA
jgi:tetrahydromethanopterin S-methyltransferase subunit F